MKVMANSKRHHYLAVISVFLVALTLIIGTAGCSIAPAKTKYFLIIVGTEDGEVTQPGEKAFLYDKGTVVNLVAKADEGCYFVNWGGNVSTIADVRAATTTITMNGTYLIYPVFGREIRDWYDLDSIRDNLIGSHTLMNDLDSTTPGYEELAGPTANQGKGWQPIGTSPLSTFIGTFDGQGHEIRDLFINRPNESPVGLFAFTGQGGVIKNVGLVNLTVTGYYYAGGLVGCNSGIVTDSYTTGSVSGIVGMVGGLAGRNTGTVGNSYSIASVSGVVNTGSLVGDNWGGTVSNSYATGNVIGYSCVGGLVAYDNKGTVSNSYSASSVTGNALVGGLVGRAEEHTVSSSFWDTEISGQATSDGGTGKTTGEMKDIATFSGASWNITAVANPSVRNPSYSWNIVDNVTYPFLSWQPV
jgi:hypothetical protein